MTTPPNPSRRAGPSAREIAELTARLRGISARGRDVDPLERAAFIADKNALIARITDIADADAGPAVGFDQAYYSAADIAAIADAAAAGDTQRAQYLQDRPWLAQGFTVDAAHLDVAPGYSLAEAEQQQERREQLGRWHADDHATNGAGVGDGDEDVAELPWVCDDGPGLP